MIPFRKQNDEVLYPASKHVEFAVEDIQQLKKMADKNPRGRIRLCAHQNLNDVVHEMIIVHRGDCYVRPHRHMTRDESIYVIEGEADLVIFNDDGLIRQVVAIGDITSNATLFCKIAANTIHTLLFKTRHLVFKEVTQGPFDCASVFFPTWAPTEEDPSVHFYLQELISMTKKLRDK